RMIEMSRSPRSLSFGFWISLRLRSVALMIGACCGAGLCRADSGAAKSSTVRDISIDGRAGRFASIQAAIDAAPDKAVIRIGAGRFDERLKIRKTVTLVGAGPDKTVLGPTKESQAALREQAEKDARRVETNSKALSKPEAVKLAHEFKA